MRNRPKEFSIRFVDESGEIRKVLEQKTTPSHPTYEAIEAFAITFICKSPTCWWW